MSEIGRAIADAYRVFDFDPETFVCIGDGRPIGYPRIDFDVEPWETRSGPERDDPRASFASSPPVDHTGSVEQSAASSAMLPAWAKLGAQADPRAR